MPGNPLRFSPPITLLSRNGAGASSSQCPELSHQAPHESKRSPKGSAKGSGRCARISTRFGGGLRWLRWLYRLDPLAQASLEVEDYLWIGEQVALLPCPAFAILEGGYSEDLGQLMEAFLLGWSISTGEHMDPQGSNLQPTMKTR